MFVGGSKAFREEMGYKDRKDEFQRRYVSLIFFYTLFVAIEPADLPHGFKLDCMQLVKRAKVFSFLPH